MTLTADLQTLEPGALMTFFQLDATAIGGGVVYFHGMNDQTITWQGIEYAPWPMNAEGFARTSDQQPRPTLSVANLNGAISLLCMTLDDMVGTVLMRLRTFGKYLDAINFDDGNEHADPTQQFPPEVWFVDRKSSETREAVTFELASALDFNGVRLPRRQIIANQCSFVYRGPLCNYVGAPVADINDNPTSDPTVDACSKKLAACKLRIWPDGVLNFGGYPAAGLVRL